jgi:hypothetical protein
MKRIESPPVIVPMLRVTYAPDADPAIQESPRQPRIRRAQRKRRTPSDNAQCEGLDQVRARLLKMIVQNERERSHDHRAS